MFVAIKYARKKYKARQQQRQPQQQEPDGEKIQLNDQLDGESSTAIHPNATDDGADSNTPKETEEEKKARRRYRYKILLGLMAPFMLQSLDMTIVAAALPFIAEDFNQVSELNWIISAFNLTSAAFLPFWAQSADVFGRLATLLITLVTMLVGSAICTGAPTTAFGFFLFGRALQGIGVAGISICVRAVLADRVSLADYAINWTFFALMSTVGFSVGPVIGGYMTAANWRWCFAINLPVGVVGGALVVLLLRGHLVGPQPQPGTETETGTEARTWMRWEKFLARLATFDVGGQLLFLWGLGLLILAFTWAGSSYSWSSAAVLAPLIVGALLTVAWMAYEYAMAPGRALARVFPRQRPMMPWELLAKRDIGLLFFINTGMGMAMFAVMYFMDLYFTLVAGNPASQAGVGLLYYLPGLGLGAYMAILGSNVWPRQTLPPLLLGATTTALGISLLPWAMARDDRATIYAMMALTGHGIGMRLNPASLHGLAYFPDFTAPITCLVAFAMPFGGILALTIMDAVFNNRDGLLQQDPLDGVRWAFIAMIPIMWFCLVLTTFLGNVWILKNRDHEVVNGIYLWSFLFGEKLVREQRKRGGRAVIALKDEMEKKPGDVERAAVGGGVVEAQ